MGWATFWATFSQTHLVTLITPLIYSGKSRSKFSSTSNFQVKRLNAFHYREINLKKDFRKIDEILLFSKNPFISRSKSS
jgi:hypothetical protein